MKKELDTILIAVSATVAALFVHDVWQQVQAHAADMTWAVPSGSILLFGYV